MIKTIREYSWSFWLGLSVAIFADLTLIDWEFYAILVPLAILVPWSQNEN